MVDYENCEPINFGNDELIDKEIDEWLDSIGEEVKPKRKYSPRSKNKDVEEDDELIIRVDMTPEPKPLEKVELLSGIRIDKNGNSYRVARVNGVVKRFFAEKDGNYKFI